MTRDVIAVIGAGGIGRAIARRQGFGRTILLADWNEETLARASAELSAAGYAVEPQAVDVTSRASVRALAEAAAARGPVMQVVNTAGLSPNMAPAEKLLAVDLYGSAVVFEEFGKVIAEGGAGLIISNMAGHMMRQLPQEHENQLAHVPADELLALPCLQAEAIPNTSSPTWSPSAPMSCACRRKPSSGANAAPESMRSAQALSSPHWLRMS